MSERSGALSRRVARFGWLLPLVIGLVVALAGLAAGLPAQREIVLIAIYTLVVGGLNLSWGYGGELSFGQPVIFAAAAYTTGILANAGVTDLLVAGVVALVVAAVLGLISGIPGLRLSNWSLAMTSFFLILLIPKVVSIFQAQTGGLVGLPVAARPTLIGVPVSGIGLYVVAIVCAVGWLMVMRNLVLSRHGLAFRALQESPQLARSLGYSVGALRIKAYTIGGLPAGIAGVIYAYFATYLAPTSFTLDLAIAFIAASVVGGSMSVYGAAIGSALLVLGPLQSASFQSFSLLAYGAFLIIAGVVFRRGISGLARRGLRRLGITLNASVSVTAGSDAEPPQISIPGERLIVSGLVKSFGGLRALDGVELEAAPGQITAIIGANGAGKTTVLNAVSGFVRPDEGTATLGENAIGGLRPEKIARLGLGRTFQTPLIPEEMSALEVVLSGRAGERVGLVASILRLPRFRRARRADEGAATAALAFGGLLGVADESARSLPLGTRRLLEVVRAVAAQPHVLLLDEPAAGLDDSSLADLGNLIRRARDAGATVLLVEHNVPFVLGLADTVYVMDLGRVIASGAPEVVKENPAVIATYLGRRPATVRKPRPAAVAAVARMTASRRNERAQ